MIKNKDKNTFCACLRDLEKTAKFFLPEVEKRLTKTKKLVY
jgi:hypothetical protein